MADHIDTLLPNDCSMLDVGCGDGRLAKTISDQRPDVWVEGIDVLIRPDTKITAREFDGDRIPYADDSIDVVMMIDVLHHTDDPNILLKEASRVSRRLLLIKDHILEGFLAGPTLRFMDWVGNAHHNVRLPYNYWRYDQWLAAFESLGLTLEIWKDRLDLYPPLADRIFGRSLHFLAVLTSQSPHRGVTPE